MKKKKILSLLLMISIIGSTTLLGGGVALDPVLENANKITRKLFYDSLEEGDDKTFGNVECLRINEFLGQRIS